MYMSPKLIPIVILVFYLASKIRVVNFVVEEYLDLQQAKAPDLIFVNFGTPQHYLCQ